MTAATALLGSFWTNSAGGGRKELASSATTAFDELLKAAQSEAAEGPSQGASESGSDPAAIPLREFEDWKQAYLKRGISADRRQQVQEDSAEFVRIISEAAKAGADRNAAGYLEALSSADRDVLQRMHSLADPIDPGNLTAEGATNLLRSPGSALDVDKDGFQMVGRAKLWQFPPVDAPESVKQAWKDTTAKLSDEDVLLLEGAFLPITLSEMTGQSAYLGPNADYRALVSHVIQGAEFSSRFDEPWQVETRQRELELLRAFHDRL